MPREGDITSYGVEAPIITFGNGSTAVLRGWRRWGINDEGEPLVRVRFDPFPNFLIKSQIHPDEYKLGGLLEMIIPHKYFVPLDEDPADPRWMILVDFRTGEHKIINDELEKKDIALATAEARAHTNQQENSKLKQENIRLVQEGVDWDKFAEMVAQKIYELQVQNMMRSMGPQQPGFQ